MKRILALTTCLLAMPGAALAQWVPAEGDALGQFEIAAFEAGQASGAAPTDAAELFTCFSWTEALQDVSDDYGWWPPERMEAELTSDLMDVWLDKGYAMPFDGDSEDFLDDQYDAGEAMITPGTDEQLYQFYYFLGRCTLSGS